MICQTINKHQISQARMIIVSEHFTVRRWACPQSQPPTNRGNAKKTPMMLTTITQTATLRLYPVAQPELMALVQTLSQLHLAPVCTLANQRPVHVCSHSQSLERHSGFYLCLNACVCLTLQIEKYVSVTSLYDIYLSPYVTGSSGGG